MRHYPNENEELYEDEQPIVEKAKDWMIELLKRNPDYCAWGNYEDYMCKDGKSWDSRCFEETWKDFINNWNLDELNEVLNFYFEVYRDSEECSDCKGTGYNPETTKIANSFYDHQADDGRGWSNDLTKDEIEALADFRDLTIEEAKKRSNGERCIGMDGLDRMKLVKQRAKRKGVYGKCNNCDGKGFIYTDDESKVALQLWVLHPRKGCSRGVYIKRLEKEDIPRVLEFLRKAKARNEERFKGVSEPFEGA